ncbi:uncharacterized protein LOC113147003, partial [Cyclospora cayetanensis]|uniref:Uncharacterized protein LOC113147003 n=1 Tax=Cyclospora cayetanensis TaxID=88456 RepID=A0A6P6RVF3_9EIME
LDPSVVLASLRAYHHLRLSRLCVPLYLRCLSILGGPPESCGGPQSTPDTDAPPPSWQGESTAQDPTLREEWTKLRMCAAFNLYSLWAAQGALPQAQRLAATYLLWD